MGFVRTCKHWEFQDPGEISYWECIKFLGFNTYEFKEIWDSKIVTISYFSTTWNFYEPSDRIYSTVCLYTNFRNHIT